MSGHVIKGRSYTALPKCMCIFMDLWGIEVHSSCMHKSSMTYSAFFTMWLLWKCNSFLPNATDVELITCQGTRSKGGHVLRCLRMCTFMYQRSSVRLRCTVHAHAGNHPQLIVYCAASLYTHDNKCGSCLDS